MGIQSENQTERYPKELIDKSRKLPNGVVRIGGRESTRLKYTESESQLTFQEISDPELGVVYDSFDIQKFTIDRNLGKVKVCARMSLKAKHEQLSIFAKLVSQDEEKVLSILPLRFGGNTCELEYAEEAILPKDSADGDVTLIVYGAWGTKEIDDAEIAIVENYAEGAPSVKYEHIHPEQHKGNYITFPQGKTLSQVEQVMPYTAGDCTDNDSHIVVALYRRPEDTSDLDYLCLFGQKPGTNLPILGVPGRGTLLALSGSRFLFGGNDKPTASCCITPIGGTGGGRMLVASSASYKAGEGAIKLNINESTLEYDMTGPWGVTYNEVGSWQTKYFDYEFTLSYTLQTGLGTSKRHTSYICSNRESCLKKVAPIALKYGCFSRGTNIVMAGGMQKKIEDIRIGDFVWSEEGILLVRNIWSGKDIILNIKLEDETFLGVTGDHPLQTLDGWIKAKDVHKGMYLKKAQGGGSCKVLSIEEGGEAFVYNLETEKEEGSVLSANGIAAGDFAMQNNM